jgi:ABC-type nitrate/sulfonate/bicarbonate transport system permease component
MRVALRLRPLLLPLAFVVAWELAGRLLSTALGPALPPPSGVLAEGWRVLASGDLAAHVARSLWRVLGGFLAAVAIGVPVGAGIALSSLFDDVVDPVVEFLRPIPPIAWIPLGILWFGIGDTQNMFIIFLGAFFPVVLNTIAGVRAVDRTLVWGALTLGGNRRQIVGEIVLPGALPMILTGCRIGLGVGWMALVAAELVAARSGLGFMIQSARYALVTERVILGMAVIGLLGLCMDRGMRWLEGRASPWASAGR